MGKNQEPIRPARGEAVRRNPTNAESRELAALRVKLEAAGKVLPAEPENRSK